MACVACEPWPDPEDVPGCCEPPEDFDEDLAAVLWASAVDLVHRLTGGCWQVCTHTFDLCRPCRCPSECDPCGCCAEGRVQVPWTCGTLDTISSDGVDLDPDLWRLEAGWLWPAGCNWPCQVSASVLVGDAPPAGLLTATKSLWCRLISECLPDCSLPPGTISATGPDGVTVEIRPLDEWLAQDLTGGRLVDLIVSAYRCPRPEVRMIDPVDWSGAVIV